jgi:integrase
MGFWVFKPTYTDRTGKQRPAAKWYVQFSDQKGTLRRLPAFTSKAASEEMGRNLVKLVEYHNGTGGQTDPTLTRWLAGLPDRTRDKLVSIGLLDAQRVAVSKPLADHLDDWAEALRAKGNSAIHVDVVTARARRVTDGCGFKFHADISASRVLAFLSGLRADQDEKRGISAQTFNFYLQAIKQFCKWMVKDRRAAESPVMHLSGLNVKTDRRRDRRALTVDELRSLLKATARGRTRSGLSGPVRALLYRVALETGLRANELRTLTRTSFDLDGPAPTVTVEASYSKHRRQDTLPLRPELAADLRQHLARLPPEAPAFRLPKERKTAAAIFRADVEAAGIAYRDDAGRVADFHALRHTFISNLARGGVHPKVAQALARHSTITLTMDRYTHSLMGEQADALAVLPDLTGPDVEAIRATGTEGAADQPARLSYCLSSKQRFREILGGADRLPGGSAVESQSPVAAGISAEKPASGSVCTSGEGPGLQNQWGV